MLLLVLHSRERISMGLQKGREEQKTTIAEGMDDQA